MNGDAAALLEELVNAGCYMTVSDGVGSAGLGFELAIMPIRARARRLVEARLGDIRAHSARLVMLVIALGARN